MKKICFISLIFLLSSALFSLDVKIKPEFPEYSVLGAVTLNIPVRQNTVDFKESVLFNVDAQTVKGYVNLINNKDNFDFTLNAVFAPSFGSFNLGLSSFFHLENFYKVYVDVDYLFGAYFSSQFTKLFYLEASVFYMHLSSHIFALNDEKPWIPTQSLAFKADMNFTINDSFDCGFGVSSFNDYAFNTFLSPFWSFYGNYQINQTLTAGLKIDFLYIDMFTLSAYLKYVAVTASIKWSF